MCVCVWGGGGGGGGGVGGGGGGEYLSLSSMSYKCGMNTHAIHIFGRIKYVST